MEEFDICMSDHQLTSKWIMWVRDRKDGHHTNFGKLLHKISVCCLFTKHYLERSLVSLFGVKTVEEFFGHYVHMKRMSELNEHIDLFMFREKEVNFAI
jgi:hypothetical protein